MVSAPLEAHGLDGSATGPGAGAARAFPSLLHPPPRSALGRIVYTAYGAYNRLVARAGPYLPLRPLQIPLDACLPLYSADEVEMDMVSPSPNRHDAHTRAHAHTHLLTPAAVFAHLSQHDTLARLGLPTDADREAASPGLSERPPPKIQADAGMRFVHLQQGLSPHDVSKRRATSGPNAFVQRAGETPLDKLLGQLSEPMILLLLGSAAVSFAIGQRDDAVSITLAIAIVVTVGWVQEQRSEKSLDALNSLVPNFCHLIRPHPPPNDPTISIAAATALAAAPIVPPGARSTAPGIKVLADDLVPGDVVTFSTGDRIPADIRLFQAVQLEVDESTLTGEITPRRKTTAVTAPAWCLADVESHMSHLQTQRTSEEDQSKDNIVFMGTMVKAGYGRGVVVGTGLESELGAVFSMVDNVEEKRTPLQRSMDDLAKKLTLASFGVIGVIFLVGAFQHRSILELATIAISLAVAAIPEGLPIVVTVTLALGVLRMSQKNAIVKRLPSVETLGSVSVICTDKTGTLTENRMTVVSLYTLEDGVIPLEQGVSHEHRSGHISRALGRTLLVGNVCNRALPGVHGVLAGSPTEVAMVNVLEAFGQEDRRRWFRHVDEVPFDTRWKYMTIVGRIEGGAAGESWEKHDTSYTKGAPEAILARCSHVLGPQGTTVPLNDALLQQIKEAGEQLASNGLRVLATATGPALSSMDHQAGPEAVRANMTFCGLQAMQDPPRKGVQAAIEELTHSGVHIVMVTGDSPATALGIAHQLGILHRSATSTSSPGISSSGVMTGSQVEQMSAQQLREIAPSVSVFARTTPRHKMAIVSAFQQAGKVVGMTGDGVNDAPALKMADIGIAMGGNGTDVAKEAADVILVDDNFVTILHAVEEGKAIFGNIQNFLAFQLSTSIAALFLILLSIMAGMTLPLNAMQVLLINLACDGPPAQSLGVDPADVSVFRKPPRPKGKAVLDRRVGFHILFSATLILGGTLFVYLTEANPDGTPNERDMAMTFVTFVSLDLITAVQCRGLHVGLLANTAMALTILVSYIVLLALIYFPPLQAILQTIPLSVGDISYVIFLTAIAFGLHAVRRDLERQWDSKHDRTAAWEADVV